MPSWIIVGASRGIGYQYLKSLSQDPSNNIIGIVRDVPTVEAKVKKDNLNNVHILQGDLSDAASLTAAAAAASPLLNNTVDYLIINGAYISASTVLLRTADYIGRESILMDEVSKSVTTNTLGTLFSINAFLPLVRNSMIKKIVAISSGAADPDATMRSRMSNQIPYGISKAGQNIVVAKFAIDLEEEGILVCGLTPGYVYTLTDDIATMPDMAKPIFDDITTMLKKVQPELKGPIMPEESVTMQLKTIKEIGMEWSGKMLGHRGDDQYV